MIFRAQKETWSGGRGCSLTKMYFKGGSPGGGEAVWTGKILGSLEVPPWCANEDIL